MNKGDTVSRIENEQAKLTLSDNEQKLQELEAKVTSDVTSNEADLASKKRKREKALFDLQRAERGIQNLQLRAPAAGMVNVLTNYRASGPWGGQEVEFHEGDRAWPGAAIMELPDLSSVHLEARLDEADRGRLQVGQEATIRIEAIPGREFKATIERISVLAKVDYSSGWPPARNFELGLVLAEIDPKIRPGMSAVARIATDRIPDVAAGAVRVDLPARRPSDRLQARWQRVRRAAGSDYAARQGVRDRRVRRRAGRQGRHAQAGRRDDPEEAMKRRRLRIALVVLVVAGVGAAIAATKAAMPRMTERGAAVPTARLAKGPLRLTVHATGDLRAGRTMTLVAPPVGGMLRLVKMAPTGAMVKEGDVIVEFDPADQQFTLEQSKSEVPEAEQEIAKMKADTAALSAQDEVGLLTARFAVRRAELDASANDLIPAIEAQKNVLTLDEAKRALEQLEQDVKSRAETSTASLAVLLEKRNKAIARDAARAAGHRQPGDQGAASTASSRSRTTATRWAG